MKLDKSNIYAYGDSMKENKNDKEFSRGMVVVAHPDDAEYGSSGTVARLIREGWEFVYVMCTDGSKGSSDPGMTQSKLSKIRKQEQIDAGKVLGLKDIVFYRMTGSGSCCYAVFEEKKHALKAGEIFKSNFSDLWFCVCENNIVNI